MQDKRQGLRKSVKLVYNVLNALGMQTHPDKTFIGKGNKGFDFLGFAICPTGLTVSDATLSRRDKKIARLNEQGASKRRIGLYLARWLGWAACACVPLSHANDCSFPTDAHPYTCPCTSTIYAYRHLNGNINLVYSVLQCASASDTVCATPSDNNTPGTHFYTTTSTTHANFYSCDWTPSDGYSHAQTYTPTSPPAPAPFAPTALLFALFASLGSFFAYRANRNKSQKGH